MIATNTTLDATGYACILSGNNRVRLFSVNTGVLLTLRNLTLAFGVVTNSSAGFADGGAAVLNRGTVNAQRCSFVSNRVFGATSTLACGAQGGAIARHPSLKPETFLDEWNMNLTNPPLDPRFQPCYVAETIWQMKDAGLDWSCYYITGQ